MTRRSTEPGQSVEKMDASLAPGGAHVFNTVHNIRAVVPPENIMATLDTLWEMGASASRSIED